MPSELNQYQLRRPSRLAGITLVPVLLLDSQILQGCNKYHSSTVIRQRVDLGGAIGICSGDAGDDFATRFVERFVGLEKLEPAGHMSDDFLERLSGHPGVSMLEMLFEAMLAVDLSLAFTMNNLAPLDFAEVLPTSSPSQFDFVWQCTLPRLSAGAAQLGYRGLIDLLPESLLPSAQRETFDYDTRLAKLRKFALRRRRSLPTELLALAARRRGLPCEYLGGAYLLLGQGIEQTVINASSCTPAPAAQPRYRLHTRGDSGFPLARRTLVDETAAAQAAAAELGYPVRLRQAERPALTVQADSAHEIADAFARVQRSGTAVIVEEFVPGQLHSLLVVRNRLLAALLITPAIVRGDGRRTIGELIDELNRDPRRNAIRQHKVTVDDRLRDSLQRGGRHLEDVLDDGEELVLTSTGRVAAGATYTDVTGTVHPHNREVAVLAAASEGLPVAAIEFVSNDIEKSYRSNGGRILDIAARPPLHPYTWPCHGQGRDVSAAVLEFAFPRGRSGRIPLALVTGGKRAEQVAREANRILRLARKTVGLVLGRQALLDGRRVEPQTSSRHAAIPFLLSDPRVEAVVATMSARRVARRGLGFEHCGVTVILDSEDKNGSSESALTVLAKATSGLLIVTAANPLSKQLMAIREPQRLLLVAHSLRDGTVRRHLVSGGIAMFGEGRQGRAYIVIQKGREILAEIPTAALVDVRTAAPDREPITEQMLALALAYGTGLAHELFDNASSAASLVSPPIRDGGHT